jgi:hypothetical protein
LNGVTVNAVDDELIPGVTVKIGSQVATSDAKGAFEMDYPGSGSLTASLTGPAIVEHRTVVTVRPGERLRLPLISAGFDIVAFDQMFRGPDHRLKRWTSAPALVVLTTVMNYTRGLGATAEYYATSEQLTETETTLLIEQLTEALAMLTGNTFTAFASVQRESVPVGSKINPLQEGKIIVGRYNNIGVMSNTIGLGGSSGPGDGRITAGMVYLDTDLDKNSDARRLLRTHELGHALGYYHVTARQSIMNPVLGPEPTMFDRQASIIAFQRMPGNQSPDTDPGASSTGGIFSVAASASSSVWPGPATFAPRAQ